MSRGYPSRTALLALLVVAGYQNRNKIAEWIDNPGATVLPRQSGASAAYSPRKGKRKTARW